MEATQLENRINYLEKIKIDSIKKSRKEFVKNNKLKLKIPQRFKRRRHNVFTEEINKISLSSNDDKMIGSIKTYAHGTSKVLVSEKKETKCDNIIRQYKND